MEKQWEKYIKKNRTDGDCQLVTAVNAYCYLTGKTISNEEYDNLVDLVGCRICYLLSAICGKALFSLDNESDREFLLRIHKEIVVNG